MAASVGEAFGILRGYKAGDAEMAKQFLDSMPQTELILRNRNESRLRSVRKKRNPMAKDV